MYNKLLEIKQDGIARVEYQCKECGYMLYKPVMGEDFLSYLEKWDNYLVLNCPCCDEKSMNLVDLWSEKEWLKIHKYAEG
jgi:hypothetical protein